MTSWTDILRQLGVNLGYTPHGEDPARPSTSRPIAPGQPLPQAANPFTQPQPLAQQTGAMPPGMAGGPRMASGQQVALPLPAGQPEMSREMQDTFRRAQNNAGTNTIQPRTTTMGERLEDFIAGDQGQGPRRNFAKGLTGLTEMSPAGALLAMGDLYTAQREGRSGDAAMSAIAAVPLPGASMVAREMPEAARGAARAVKAAVSERPPVSAEKQAQIADFVASMPSVASRGDAPLVEQILNHAARRGDKSWPEATEPVFKVNPETYAATTELVPQSREFWNDIPRPAPGEKLPNQGRAQQIVENKEPIAQWLAGKLGPGIREGQEVGKFYHTGPVLMGLMDEAGLSPAQANQHMRDWSGQGAGTSPRTTTPPNLRNASYLDFRRAQGRPFTEEEFNREGNLPGMRMMGFHAGLSDKFANDQVDLWRNPKPGTFRENWRGNLEGVTMDTHGIRDTLIAMDAINPGSLHRGWFNSDDAYRKYREEGRLPYELDVGSINDSLGSIARKGRSAQVEYGAMADPMMRTGEILGVPGSTVQAQGWFGLGDRTGLKSPPRTIPMLLNDQIEDTARATGMHPLDIMKLWAKKRIPLASRDTGSGVA